MKFKKIILMFLVIVNTLIALPTMAEELPAIDITQLEDGSVKVSSDSEAAISGFISLTIKSGTREVVILPKDVTADSDGFVFSDPQLNGTFAYVFVYGEDTAITGNVVLTFVEEVEEAIEPSETSLKGVDPLIPEIYAHGLSNKMLLEVSSEEENVKFEILYSTKKNGTYKDVTQYDYSTGSIYDSYSGWEYWSTASAYIKNPKVGKKYYIKARAYTDVAGVKTYSKWEKITIKVKVGGIKNIVAKLTAANKLNVKWAKAKKAKKYELEVTGYQAGTKTAYDAHVGSGGNPNDFLWYQYEEDIAFKYSKKRNFTFNITGIDKNMEMIADVSIWNAGTYQYSQSYNVIIDDEFCRPVQNVSVAASSTGEEVEFTFKSPVDITKYDMKRRDFLNLGISAEGLNALHEIKLEKSKERKSQNGSSLDRMRTQYTENECLYDFNLFVATKPNGTYKRVKTKADFSNPNNLKLSYKAKRGKKLYYKILPTVESIYWEAYYFPELHDPSNVSYYVNLVETPMIVDFNLPK